MKNADFKKLLFRGSILAIACDGEIADSEIEEIKKHITESLYFEGMDHETELRNALSVIDKLGLRSVQEYFVAVSTGSLSVCQQFQLLEVLLKIVYADGKVEEDELIFLHNVRRHLRDISDEQLVLRFPRHVKLFLDLARYGNQPLRDKLDGIDVSGLKNFSIDRQDN